MVFPPIHAPASGQLTANVGSVEHTFCPHPVPEGVQYISRQISFTLLPQ